MSSPPESLDSERPGADASRAGRGDAAPAAAPSAPRRCCSAHGDIERSAVRRAGDAADPKDQGQMNKRGHRRSNSLDLSAGRCEAEVLRKLRLRAQECGARNKTKWRRRVIWNQCFYLSIAHAYMGTCESNSRTRRLARKLRDAIEAAVLQQHP